MELTVPQIKDKQEKLEKDIKARLSQFESETGLTPTGEINWGHTKGKDQYWLSLNYPNPFM